jgi:hypothetical protein
MRTISMRKSSKSWKILTKTRSCAEGLAVPDYLVIAGRRQQIGRRKGL